MFLYIIHYSKVTKGVYACTVRMSLPGWCVSAGTLLLNYCAAIVVHTKLLPVPCWGEGISNTHKLSWNGQKFDHRSKTKNDCASKDQQQFTSMLCCAKLRPGWEWLYHSQGQDRKIWSRILTTNCPQNYSSLSSLICHTYQACNWKFPRLSSYPCITVMPKLSILGTLSWTLFCNMVSIFTIVLNGVMMNWKGSGKNWLWPNWDLGISNLRKS
jgi:hypothetical protein